MPDSKPLNSIINRAQKYSPHDAGQSKKQSTTIDSERIRRQKIRNDNAISDQKMKERALDWLFSVLAIEICFIFCIALLQGMGNWGSWFHFHIDEWCFNLLVTGVFVQTAAMMMTAIKHLFPTSSH